MHACTLFPPTGASNGPYFTCASRCTSIHAGRHYFVVPASNLPCTLTLSPNPQTCTIDAARTSRSATSGTYGVDQLHQRCTSALTCVPTRMLATAECALGQQVCSNAIATYQHCKSIDHVEIARSHVDSCRRQFGTLEHSTVPVEHLCQPECSRPNVHAAA